MQVTFQLNPSDLMASSHLEHKPIRVSWFNWILMALVVFPFGFPGWKGVAVVSLLWVACEVGIYFVSKRAEKSTLEQIPFLFEPITLTVSDEGVSTSVGKPLPWSNVDRIVETKAHFFVAVNGTTEVPYSGFRGAFIIPKRAFDSPAQCAEFGGLLKRKWADHHGDAPPIAAAK